MSKALRESIVFTQKDARERIEFLTLQTKLWRSLAIILAHHPELAKRTVVWMGLFATYAGDEKRLRELEPGWIKYAQRCGRSLGVFEGEEDREQCDGNAPSLFWVEK